MAILYVAAEAAELKPFAASLTGVRKLNWPIDYAFEGILGSRRVMLAANGAGPALASRAVEVAIRAVTAADLSSSKLEAIVNTGFCGALNTGLREGDIVVANEVVRLDNGERFLCGQVTTASSFVPGVVVSQDRVAGLAGEKEQLRSRGTVVDMEAAGVAARTKRAELPFYCIKVVSDRSDESFGFDFNQMRTREGRIARGKIVLYALTHPNLIPELLRLGRRAGHAARALGEFLASCRIVPEQVADVIE